MPRSSARIIQLREKKKAGELKQDAQNQGDELLTQVQHLCLTDENTPSHQEAGVGHHMPATTVTASSEEGIRPDSDYQKLYAEAAIVIASRDAYIAELERNAAAAADVAERNAAAAADAAVAAADAAVAAAAAAAEQKFENELLACEKTLAEITSEIFELGRDYVNKINPYSLMISSLPEYDDFSSLRASASTSAESVGIKVIAQNDSFKRKQLEFTRSKREEFSRRDVVDNFPCGPSPSGQRTAASEIDLSAILGWTVFFALNRLLMDAGVLSASVGHSGASAMADGSSYIAATLQCLLLYEFKRHNLTHHGADLFRNCLRTLHNPESREGSKDALAALQQLVGYMCIEKLRYAILTTYEFFWAVELCEDGCVLISDPYEWSTEGEGSVLSMLVYFIHLARASLDDERPFIPPKLPKLKKVGHSSTSAGARGNQAPTGGGSDGGSDDKENRGPGTRRGRGQGSSAHSKRRALGEARGGRGGARGGEALEGKAGAGAGCGWGLEASSYDVVRYLEDHSDRITFQVLLDGPEGRRLVAVKAYDSELARDAEAGHYRALRGVEGVPDLVAGALELAWNDAGERRVHALVVAWVGPPDAGGRRLAPAPPLPVAALGLVRDILGAMHARGVAHGDVRPANLGYDAAAGRAFVFDFSHSVARGGGGGFEAQCRTDMQRVEELMRKARAWEAGL